MRKSSLLPYFLASVLLLLVLVSLWVFSESRWLQQEFVYQVETKGTALAHAMETSAKNAIQGNTLIEELVSQRLLDNARLIDQLLLSQPPEPALLQEISRLNRLSKIELLDLEGQPWPPAGIAQWTGPMEGFIAEFTGTFGEHPLLGQQTLIYVWGKLWPQPNSHEDFSAPILARRRFWEGSVFGVAVGARSFPGIIAIHADTDYVLNFQEAIGVQRQIEDLGRQKDIVYVALLDNDFSVVAHTDPSVIGKRLEDDLIARVRAEDRTLSRIAYTEDGHRSYQLVKPISLNGSPLGFLRIGLSLDSADAAWRRNLWFIVALGLGILALGVLGLSAIFYNQRSHMQEIKALEAEVNRHERLSAMGNLAATVAHEVRNPLNSISMGLQRLKAEFRPTSDEQEYSHFIGLMREEVQRLNAIVEQFLSLARPLDLKLVRISIDELLSELTTLIDSDAKSARVEVTVENHSTPVSIEVDPNYLKQVLLNLLLNAIQAMPDGGQLKLDTSVARRTLVISVSDTGTGIPQDKMAQIFEPYFTTKNNGSGLGLAIARRIVEAHGGTISVHSTVGRGSRFEIRLPLEGRFPSPR